MSRNGQFCRAAADHLAYCVSESLHGNFAILVVVAREDRHITAHRRLGSCVLGFKLSCQSPCPGLFFLAPALSGIFVSWSKDTFGLAGMVIHLVVGILNNHLVPIKGAVTIGRMGSFPHIQKVTMGMPGSLFGS